MGAVSRSLPVMGSPGWGGGRSLARFSASTRRLLWAMAGRVAEGHQERVIAAVPPQGPVPEFPKSVWAAGWRWPPQARDGRPGSKRWPGPRGATGKVGTWETFRLTIFTAELRGCGSIREVQRGERIGTLAPIPHHTPSNLTTTSICSGGARLRRRCFSFCR